MTTARAVTDGKMNNEELGLFTRRVDEIKRRINEGTLLYPWVMGALQGIVEGRKLIPRRASQGVIKRSFVINAAEFVGPGHGFWRGPIDGKGLEGDLDQDERSLALDELDLTKIQFETCLVGDDKAIKGEEKLLRLKAKPLIRLDPGWIPELLKDPTKIPEHWQKKGYIPFDGQILRYPYGYRGVLCLGWGGRAWLWRIYWLDRGFSANYPSAVLAG